MIRRAKAVWHGTGRDGSGDLSSDSQVLNRTPYSYKTRFENEKGTNPEELIAAAHAGCFTMAYDRSGGHPRAGRAAGFQDQSFGADAARTGSRTQRGEVFNHRWRRRAELSGLQGAEG